MKTQLPILGEVDDREPPAPSFVSVEEHVIRIDDAHLGNDASEVAHQLLEAGALPVEGEPAPTLRVAVRSTPRSQQAHARAEALECDADIVLASVRPGFAEALLWAAGRRQQR